MRIYAGAGVNRVSIGVQSMVPSRARLARSHARAGERRARGRRRFVRPASRPSTSTSSTAARARALDDWRATLEGVLALDPPHISAYALDRRGRHAAWPTTRHVIPTTTISPTSTSSPTTCSTAAGLDNYEVSNWALPGHECRHNVLYWQQGDYRGFGSRRPLTSRRPPVVERAHARALHRCRRRPARSTEAAGETLDDETRRIEGLQLALRMSDGVPVDALDADGLDGLVVTDGRARAADPNWAAAGQRSVAAAALTGSVSVLHGRVAQLVRVPP